jgi:DNA-binding transcriptional regulator YdaS (Cro superfamily)
MNLNDYLKTTTQDAFAKAVGVTQSMVAQWVAGARITAERAVMIERATNGAITRGELRPDLFGNETSVKRKNQQAA